MSKQQSIRRMIEKECQRYGLVDLCEYWEVTCKDFYAFLDNACRAQPSEKPLTLSELMGIIKQPVYVVDDSDVAHEYDGWDVVEAVHIGLIDVESQVEMKSGDFWPIDNPTVNFYRSKPKVEV